MSTLKKAEAALVERVTAGAKAPYSKLKNDLYFDEIFIEFFEKFMLVLGVPRAGYANATCDALNSSEGAQEIQISNIKASVDMNVFNACKKLHSLQAKSLFDAELELTGKTFVLTVGADRGIWETIP